MRSPSFVVPRQHEAVLVVPPKGELAAIADENAEQFGKSRVDLNGLDLKSLRQQARGEVLAEAVRYTERLVQQTIPVEQPGKLIVTGHQPELFHAGVWAKNFAAAGVARQVHGQALNLIIDNDTLDGTRIKVPVGTQAAPAIETIPFDAAQPQQPWEETSVVDETCFATFGERVTKQIRECWNYEPLVGSAWSAAVRAKLVLPRLSDYLTAARVAVERAHGLKNLEVPMSAVCGTRAFGHFAAFVLAHLPRFHAIYNESVREYRREHRLRSTTHPVPELDSKEGWLEAPFWVWRRGAQKRERPYVRRVGPNVELRDGSGVFITLAASSETPLETAASMLSGLSEQGIRFRTRALTTTMFARVFLADLFIHGIGGAKYDAMTDQICERFWGLQAPRFATVSATYFLPLGEGFPSVEAAVRHTATQVRELRYNPDRYVNGQSDEPISALVREKAALIRGLVSRRPSAPEHRRLVEINTALFEKLADVEQSFRLTQDRLRQQGRANAVLLDREFAWCLLPEQAVDLFFRRELA